MNGTFYNPTTTSWMYVFARRHVRRRNDCTYDNNDNNCNEMRGGEINKTYTNNTVGRVISSGGNVNMPAAVANITVGRVAHGALPSTSTYFLPTPRAAETVSTAKNNAVVT